MRPEPLYLWDMLEAVDDVARFVDGLDQEQFLSDKETCYAVAFSLLALGEAAAHVSVDIRNRYPEIPWRVLIGQRNVIAHGYFALRWIDIWKTATRDVPSLRPLLQGILDSEFGD